MMFKCRFNMAYISPFPLTEDVLRSFVYECGVDDHLEIGIGGMATIYSGKQGCDEIAVKQPHDVGDGFMRDYWLWHLKREAILLSRLAHPNIVPVYASWRMNGVWRMCMKRYDCNLVQFVREHGPLNLGRSLYIAREITKGLSYLHDLGIVQVDVKPGNVLIKGGFSGMQLPEVVLTDFSLARRSGSFIARDRRGWCLATAAFEPPDRAKAKRAPILRDDLYALMLTLYLANTGRSFFPPLSWDEATVAYVARQWTEALSEDRHVDEELKWLMPRYATCADASAMLTYIDQRFPWIGPAKTVADLDR